MNKCLILAKLHAEENNKFGVWTLVEKDQEDKIIEELGERFVFSFELNEINDEPFLKNFT